MGGGNLHIECGGVPTIQKGKKNNSFQHRLLAIGGAILIGLVTNGLYDKITSGQLWNLFQQIKTATNGSRLRLRG